MAKSTLQFKLARQAGERRLDQMGIVSLPVDPFAIAARFGILVEPKVSSEPGISGFLMRTGDSFGIMYATEIENEGRKRFTVAHELGHYFLEGHPEKLFGGRDGVHASMSGFISKDETELEADHSLQGYSCRLSHSRGLWNQLGRVLQRFNDSRVFAGLR